MVFCAQNMVNVLQTAQPAATHKLVWAWLHFQEQQHFLLTWCVGETPCSNWTLSISCLSAFSSRAYEIMNVFADMAATTTKDLNLHLQCWKKTSETITVVLTWTAHFSVAQWCGLMILKLQVWVQVIAGRASAFAKSFMQVHLFTLAEESRRKKKQPIVNYWAWTFLS